MSIIRIDEVGQESLEKAEKMLAGIDGGIDIAIKSAMSRATAYLRTNSSRQIRKVYAISNEALRAGKNVRTTYRYSPGAGVTASVIFSGNKIPLYRYDGSTPSQPTEDSTKTVNALIQGRWRQVHPGVSAAGHQMKGSAPESFENAFVARMASGHVGIFERTGGVSASGSDAIREIMGSSVPQMLGNKEVEKNLAEGTMKKFEERLDHEVDAILNGWR